MNLLRKLSPEFLVSTVNIIVFAIATKYTYDHSLAMWFNIAVAFLFINLYIFVEMFIMDDSGLYIRQEID